MIHDMSIVNPFADLQSDLQTARGKLERLQSQSQDAVKNAAELEAKLAELRSSEERDATDSVLQGRAPDPKFAKSIAACEAELKGAKKTATAHGKAVVEQAVIVDKIEAQLAARGRENFLEAFKEPRKRLEKALEEFMGAAVSAQHVLGLHGYMMSDEMFRDETRSDLRSMRIQALFSVLRLHGHWSRCYVDAPPYEAKVHPMPVIGGRPPARIDRLQIEINREQENLTTLNERLRLVYNEAAEADRDAARIRHDNGGYAPAGHKEHKQLLAIVEQKERELKTVEADRAKQIQVIAKLEREFQQKGVAA
jgi:hypothetical protein